MGARSPAVRLLLDTLDLWTSRHAFQLAGALAYYTLFSMAPLLLVLIAIAGAIFGEAAAQGQIAAAIDGHIGPQAAEAVQDAVRRSRVAEAGILPTVLGLAALVFGATTVFGQLQTALNQMWDVMARPSRGTVAVFLRNRLVSFGAVLAIGFVLLTSLVLSTAVAALVAFAEGWVPVPAPVVVVTDAAVTLALATLLFATIFKILPDVRLQWRDMWRGAGMTAVLFVAGQSLISLYLARAAPTSTYGAAGSLVLVLMWVYYSSLILLLGAALTRATVRLRGDRLVPKPGAVHVRFEVAQPAPEAGPAPATGRRGN